MKIRIGLAFSLMLLLNSCAGALKPTPEQLAVADYGDYPNNYEERIAAIVQSGLIDPYSAVFSDWRGPSKGWTSDSKEIYFGYEVCVFVNAKNRMGGYAGPKLHYFMFLKNNAFLHDGGDYMYNTIGEERIYRLCKDVGRTQ